MFFGGGEVCDYFVVVGDVVDVGDFLVVVIGVMVIIGV